MSLRLVLVRHGNSPSAPEGVGDMNRELNTKGKSEAKDAAVFIKKHISKPDLILSSPATRAMQTASIIAEAFSISNDQIQISNSIYEASSERLLYVVHEINPEYKTVILTGHNPGLSELLYLLCGKAVSMTTGSVAVVETEIQGWNSVTENCGKLISIQN